VRLVCLLSMIALLVAACTPQASLETSPPEATVATPESAATPLAAQATETPAPTPSPEATETPAVHHWQASPVLVEFWNSPGAEGGGSRLPELVVYADGRVITTPDESSTSGSTPWISEAHLSTGEVCALLTQIETDGFFEFNPSDYRPQEITDASTTYITVNAWQKQQVSAYALEYAIWDIGTKYETYIPPALLATYERLSNYSPPNPQPYQPERVALFIEWFESDSPTAAPLWPLADLSIPSLLERGVEGDGWGQHRIVTLEGTEAAEVYALFDGAYGKEYSEEGLTYHMTVRPFLPLEEWEPTSSWAWDRDPYSYVTTPTTELICDPAAPASPSTPLPSPALPDAAPGPGSPTPSPTSIAEGIVEAGAPLERLRTIGRRNAPGQFSNTSALAVTPDGEVVVHDGPNDRLQWFTLEGTFLKETPFPDIVDYSRDMALGADGTFLIADIDHQVHVISGEGELLRTLEGWPLPPTELETDIVQLEQVAQAPDGTIYLAEVHLSESYETRATWIIILNPDGTFRESWTGSAERTFGDAESLVTDTQGNLYLALDRQNLILRRSPDGAVTEISLPSPGTIVPLPDGTFYEVDRQEVRLLDSTGDVLRSWGDTYLSSVADAALAPDGSLFVLNHSFIVDLYETDTLVVHRYSPDGARLADFGETKDQPGQFRSHLTFSVSHAGDLWLLDTGDQFSTDTTPPTLLVHLDSNGAHLATFETIDDQPLACDQYQLAALSDQSIFLADMCTGRIRHIGPDGQLLQQWGEQGTGEGQFSFIRDLTLAPDEQSLFIVDEGNRRIYQMTTRGQLLQTWNGDELGVQEPVGLAVGSRGTFYILDGATEEIIVYSPSGDARRWPLPNPEDEVNTIAVDEQRGRIYVGGGDYLLYLFDSDAQFLGGLAVGSWYATLVETNPAGQVYLSVGFNEIYLYEPTEERNPGE
jgi:tripartite motif-containing protein 71